jgi:hypothetical protein
MFVGSFVGAVRVASDSSIISTGDGGGRLCCSVPLAVYAIGRAAREQLRENSAGGTAVDVSEISP